VSGDYLADLRIRVEPGPGVVASLRGVLLVVPTVQPEHEEALDALLSAATGRPVVRAVARVVADFDRADLPAFCLVVAGEGEPFALVHGPVALQVCGGDEEVRVSGLESRFWVDRSLPTVVDHLIVESLDSAGGALRRLVVEATAASLDLVMEAADHDGPGGDDVASGTGDEIGGGPGTESSGSIERRDDGDGGNRGRAVAAASVGGGGPSSVGFRPEPIKFGQGGQMEALSPSPAVNGWRESSVSSPVSAGSSKAPTLPPAPSSTLPPAPLSTLPPAPLSTLPPAPLSTLPPAPPPAPPPVPLAAPATPPSPVPLAAPATLPPPVPLAAPASAETPTSSPFRSPFASPLAPSPKLRPPAGSGFRSQDSSGHTPSGEPGAPDEPPRPGQPTQPDEPTQLEAAPSVPHLPVRRPQATLRSYEHTQVVSPPGPGLFSGPVPPPVSPSFNPFGSAAPRPPEPDLVSESPPTVRSDLGRLVMENGPDVVVDRDCVIGRNPEVDPDVAHGQAQPVVLPDAEQRISRVHARLVLTDRGVEIVDAGSVNGTWIEPPDGSGWIAMVPRVPAPLPLGSRIQVGDLVLAYVPMDGEG
jgi:hypothetical protein